MIFGLDEHRMEPDLEHRPGAFVVCFEQRRVTAFQNVQAGRQIGFVQFQEQVEVIGHQDVREDSPATSSGDALEQSKPFVPVVVVANDVLAIDAAISDVIQAAGHFDPQPSWRGEFLRNECDMNAGS